jgi:plastocyanin
MKLKLVLAIVLVAVMAAACGDSGGDDTTTTTTTGTDATTNTSAPEFDEPDVAMSGFAFVPADLTVEVGTTVTWTNEDNVDHTTTSATGLWDSQLESGDTFEFTFEEGGAFQYTCTIHPTMQGVIVVTG